MSILETILQSQDGALVRELARNFKIDNGEAGAALAKLLPALSAGLKQNTSKPGGLASLLDALRRGNHARYVEEPSILNRRETIDDGNSILGHILGSKERSREVASQAAKDTGIDVGILKKMLPMIAAMAMGSLSKQSRQGGPLSDLSSRDEAAGGGLLGGFLDRDNDGSVVDDLLGMARKYL